MIVRKNETGQHFMGQSRGSLAVWGLALSFYNYLYSLRMEVFLQRRLGML